MEAMTPPMAPSGKGQHDRDGHGPPLIKGGQTEEDDDHGKGVQKAGLGGGHAFLIGHAGPVKTDALGQLGRNLLHGGHGFSGTPAFRGFALDVHGREGVEPFQTRRSIGPVSGGKSTEGGHGSRGVAYIQPVDVCGAACGTGHRPG